MRFPIQPIPLSRGSDCATLNIRIWTHLKLGMPRRFDDFSGILNALGSRCICPADMCVLFSLIIRPPVNAFSIKDRRHILAQAIYLVQVVLVHGVWQVDGKF